MNQKLELHDHFDIQELEQRYEMGWIDGGEVQASVGPEGDFKISGKIEF